MVSNSHYQSDKSSDVTTTDSARSHQPHHVSDRAPVDGRHGEAGYSGLHDEYHRMMTVRKREDLRTRHESASLDLGDSADPANKILAGHHVSGRNRRDVTESEGGHHSGLTGHDSTKKAQAQDGKHGNFDKAEAQRVMGQLRDACQLLQSIPHGGELTAEQSNYFRQLSQSVGVLARSVDAHALPAGFQTFVHSIEHRIPGFARNKLGRMQIRSDEEAEG